MPQSFIAHERRLLSHTYRFYLVGVIIVGGFFLGLVEFVARLLSMVFREKRKTRVP